MDIVVGGPGASADPPASADCNVRHSKSSLHHTSDSITSEDAHSAGVIAFRNTPQLYAP